MIDEIQVEKTGGGVAELVLNRPAKHNAITPAMSAAIREALQLLELDNKVRCVLVRGAGERAFCAGTDLHTLDDFADAWAWRNSINYALEFNAFRKPLVAAVKGWAFGGGFEIALNCDIRVASKTAKFAAPEVKHGWLGAGGFSQRLTRLVGYGQASRILLTGKPIDAQEAYRIRRRRVSCRRGRRARRGATARFYDRRAFGNRHGHQQSRRAGGDGGRPHQWPRDGARAYVPFLRAWLATLRSPSLCRS